MDVWLQARRTVVFPPVTVPPTSSLRHTGSQEETRRYGTTHLRLHRDRARGPGASSPADRTNPVLHHVPESSLSTVLAQFFQKLTTGGYLLIGGHLGASTHTKTEGYGGLPMNVHMVKRSLNTFAELLEAHGFVIDLQATLDPASKAPGLILLAHKPV